MSKWISFVSVAKPLNLGIHPSYYNSWVHEFYEFTFGLGKHYSPFGFFALKLPFPEDCREEGEPTSNILGVVQNKESQCMY